MAGMEHKSVLTKQAYNTVIDVGANRGQFALAAVAYTAASKVFSFEPLNEPARVFKNIFHDNCRVKLFKTAIGRQNKISEMHVSNRDDSSSLLEIGKGQVDHFPETTQVGVQNVSVAPLSDFLTAHDVVSPALMKIDVQGYELEVLRGSQEIIKSCDYIYCECSFLALYEGQPLASEIIAFLLDQGFNFEGCYNNQIDSQGNFVQADLLFRNCSEANIE